MTLWPPDLIRAARTREPLPRAGHATLLSETPEGWVYRVTMTDGRVITMSVPR